VSIVLLDPVLHICYLCLQVAYMEHWLTYYLPWQYWLKDRWPKHPFSRANHHSAWYKVHLLGTRWVWIGQCLEQR